MPCYLEQKGITHALHVDVQYELTFCSKPIVISTGTIFPFLM